MNDFELVQHCLAGNSEAWNEFIDQYKKLIYWAIQKTLGGYRGEQKEEVVQELYQEVFITLLNNALPRYKLNPKATLASYIRTIAVNKTLDFLKRKAPSQDSIFDSEGDEIGKLKNKAVAVFNENNDEFLGRDEAQQISDLLLAELDETERSLYRMIYIEQKTPQDIAKIYSISRANVDMRKKRLLDKLRKVAEKKKIVRFSTGDS